MGITIEKKENLPLGRRILRIGCKGHDVLELQKYLSKAGFYFGKEDGIFGMLTGEAVTLFERAFDLKTDGVAGPQVFKLLKQNTAHRGRIIYTVKKNEGLSDISKRLGVDKSAWRRIPGQGNPGQKIYPGLKILLHEKALFCLDILENQPLNFPFTGLLCSDYQINRDGTLSNLTNLSSLTIQPFQQQAYHLIGAQRDVWIDILTSPKKWHHLLGEIQKKQNFFFGLDMREAPTDIITRWIDFLKFLCRNLIFNEIQFTVLPFLPANNKLENRLYWVNLPLLFSFTGRIMVEPTYNMENPVLFESLASNTMKDLRRLMGMGLAEKTLLIARVGGWDWNIDQNCYENMSYKVSKIIQAQFNREARYSQGSKLLILNYNKCHERHCLIYRDEKGWYDFLSEIIKFNLTGVVIKGFQELGKVGPELIASSFKVLHYEKVISL